MNQRDPLTASRLPDLPDAGYGTSTQRQLSDAIMFLIRGLERDRLLLLEIVIAGRLLFRKRFKAAYRVIGADDEFADAVFGYLALLAGPNPEASKAQVELALKQESQRRWDKRFRTLLSQSKDTQELLQAIRRDELKAERKPVTFLMGKKDVQ